MRRTPATLILLVASAPFALGWSSQAAGLRPLSTPVRRAPQRIQRAAASMAMAAAAGPVLDAQPDGLRQKLRGAGAPLAVGAVEPPPNGWFDGSTLGSCVVRRFSDEMVGDRWMMWYSARPVDFDDGVVPIATGCVGFAQSADGVTWERLVGDEAGGSCLGPNAEDWWWFDTSHVGVGDVHVMSSSMVQNSLGLYWMFYFGGDKKEEALAEGAPPVVGAAMSVGLALSNDGVHWGRVEGEHASGAILEPQEGQLFLGWPQVVEVSKEKWHMYFHAYDLASKKFAIGLASSSNCVEWKHEGYCLEPGPDGSFTAGGVSARCIVRDPKGDGWLMLFEAQDASKRHTIGLARSPDALSWEVHPSPVLSPAEDDSSWDAVAVARPWVVPMDDGSARLYYVGRSASGTQGIGMAVSAGADWTTFERHEMQRAPP